MRSKIIFSMLMILALGACTKGPLVQSQQKQFSGGFFTHWTNSVVQDSLLVSDGENFYFGTKNGNAFSVRAKNQKQNWRAKLSTSVDTSALIDGDRVFFGTGDGMVHALDRKSGKTIWASDVSAPPRGMLTKAGGYVVVGTNEGIIYALNTDNGQIAWKYRQEPYEKMKIQFFVKGAVDQNKLFAGFPNGELVALDASNGTELWKQWIVQPEARFYDLSSVTLIPQKGILVTSVQGEAALFSFQGQRLWAYANISTQSAPFVMQDQIVIAAKEKVLFSNLDGTEKKSIPYGKTIRPAGVAVDNGNIYVTAFDGGLYVFNEQTSQLVWEYQMGSAIQGAPMFLDGKIWTLNRRGQLISMMRR
jgi:outer membrane protein assembly factor BamB